MELDLDPVNALISNAWFYADHYMHIIAPAVGGSIVLGLIAWTLLRDRNEPVKTNVVILEERRMTKEERASYVKRTIADTICNALETAVDDGKLTPDDVIPYYETIGKRCGLKELLPGGVLPSSIKKKQIKQRLINGDRTPVRIPEGPQKKEPRNRLEAIFMRNAS